MNRSLLALTIGLAAALPALGAPKQDKVEQARRLHALIEKERPAFEERKRAHSDLSERLDSLNADQNEVRKKIRAISMNYQELSMALENLSMEAKRQQESTLLQKQRLVGLLKLAHKIQRDGVLRFLINGDNLGSLAGRARILFRTLKSHSRMARQLEEKAQRLAESEKKILAARNEEQFLLEELKQQEKLLQDLLREKKKVVAQIEKKQASYMAMYREFTKISRQVGRLFSKFEGQRGAAESNFPRRRTLPLPVEQGRVVKHFGRHVHERFKTVTYQKGIEIAAEHNAPVRAVLPGVVEYEGWVKGLGNVLIIHHGGGFYSLSAHLHVALTSEGTRVEQGETIGLVGDTGNSDFPGLYFEIRENGKAVDPLMYFSPTALKDLS